MKKLTLFFLCLSLCIIPTSVVNARIDIVPQKIVIGSRERGGEIAILNLFNKRGTFRIEMVSFRQNENGIYEELDSPLDPQFDPSKIVRLSPRQFSLAPGGRQTVRLSIRKPADLPEGEYRFHVKAIRLAQDDERRQARQNNVSVIANIGVTIPVIVRHGNTDVSAKLSNPVLVEATRAESKKPELHFQINREGNASSIGLLEVLWQPQGAEARRIGRITNANVFTDITTRNMKVPLTEMPLGQGQLLIRYADSIQKGKIFDEITLQR